MTMLKFFDGSKSILTNAWTAVSSGKDSVTIHYTSGGAFGTLLSTGVNSVGVKIPMNALERACSEGSPIVDIDALASGPRMNR